MKHKNTYTLRDSDGTVIGRYMFAKDVAEVTGIKGTSVAPYANNGLKISGRWSVEVDGQTLREGAVPEKFSTRWDEAVKPFRRVIWVKHYAPGVKRLKVG